jgi:hypothetical protein
MLGGEEKSLLKTGQGFDRGHRPLSLLEPTSSEVL